MHLPFIILLHFLLSRMTNCYSINVRITFSKLRASTQREVITKITYYCQHHVTYWVPCCIHLHSVLSLVLSYVNYQGDTKICQNMGKYITAGFKIMVTIKRKRMLSSCNYSNLNLTCKIIPSKAVFTRFMHTYQNTFFCSNTYTLRE
jgi:hypothetical protein